VEANQKCRRESSNNGKKTTGKTEAKSVVNAEGEGNKQKVVGQEMCGRSLIQKPSEKKKEGRGDKSKHMGSARSRTGSHFSTAVREGGKEKHF